MRYRRNFGIFGSRPKKPPLGPPPTPKVFARPTVFQTATGNKLKREDIRSTMDEHARDLYKDAEKERKKIYGHSKILADSYEQEADKIQLMSEEEYCDYTGKCEYRKMNPGISAASLVPHVAYGAASGAAFFGSAYLLDKLRKKTGRKTAKNPLTEGEMNHLLQIMSVRMIEVQGFIDRGMMLDAFFAATEIQTILNMLGVFGKVPGDLKDTLKSVQEKVFRFLDVSMSGIKDALQPLPLRPEFSSLDFPKFALAENPNDDVVGQIMAFESGELSADDTLDLFSHLLKTGMIRSLQGFYQRTARDLIQGGYLTPQGKILKGFGSPEHPPGD